jgi:hypothetical protein
MKLTGKTQEQMFGKYAERDAQGNIMPETISKNSIYGQKSINQVLLNQGNKTLAAQQIAQSTKEQIPATGSGSPSALQPTKFNPNIASQGQIDALAKSRETAADVAAQGLNALSDETKKLIDAFKQAGTDLKNFVLEQFGRGPEKNPAGVTPPSEDQMNAPKGANESVIGASPVTASVNNTNSFNFNINGGGAVGDDGKVMALTAAIGQLQEELRVYKAENGDRQPPSTLAMRA